MARESLPSLLRGKKKVTVREVIYFAEVTQLVGNSFFSWALEAVWSEQEG